MPITGQVALISGQVTTSTGAPVPNVTLHVIYETGSEFDSPSETGFDVLETSWVTLKVFDIRGNEEATLVDGLFSSGRHQIAINAEAFHNGVHQLRFQVWTADRDSLIHSAERWWLKNIADPNVLFQSVPIATTNSSGHYGFYTAADLAITVRDENGSPDSVLLNRVTVLALSPDDRPPNYMPVWQTMDVRAEEHVTVNLTVPNAPQLPPGIAVRIGDTTYVIPDSAQQFADSNFRRDAYLLYEYQLATNPQYNSTPYMGTLAEYKNELWDTRRQYLANVVGFNYDIQSADFSEYYDWISRITLQFGFGWRDTYRANAEVINPSDPQLYIWDNPSDPTNEPDDPNSISFDGTSHLLERYRGMWIRITG